MAIFIKKIELNNWFGYEGAYENNVFEFTKGVNIIVAGNDVGKSKLHNAFRWLLSDQVILKNRDNKYELLRIDLNTIAEILNHNTSNSLLNEERATIGVRLTFEETDARGEVLNRIIKKEITCKKDVNRITLSEPSTTVQKFQAGNIRTAPEKYEDIITKIIRPNLRDFFLVQGESLEHLTPLRGEKLRTTINNLVSINELDKKGDIAIKIASAITTLRQGIETAENRNNHVARQNTERKIILENEINNINDVLLPQVEAFRAKNNEILNEFRGQAEIAKSNNKLVKEIDDFNSKIFRLEGAITSGYNNLVDNYINGEFWLSKITNNQNDSERLSSFMLELRGFSAERRTELDDTLSKKEQQMLNALERDQPRPEILKQMLDENICYVCANELSTESRNYMVEKLIPFFRNELNRNDEELNKYTELNGIYQRLQSYLNKFNFFETNFLQTKIVDIANKEVGKRGVEDEKAEFISENGVLTKDDIDNVSLATYDTALKDLLKYERELNSLKEELASKTAELGRLETVINRNGEENIESPKLIKSRKLERFGNEIKDVLLTIKTATYQQFSRELEAISNEKFKAFSTANDRFRNQSIKVEFSLNHLNEPNFEIKVIDQVGNNLTQGGGASQALRQLAVIFGLIEKAGGNVNFPFIADAPTSNMSHTLSEHFFNYQLDHAATQNILITKELWDDSSKNLNEMGNRILNRVEGKENAKMISIVTNRENTKRVNIINHNNQN